MPRSVKVRKDYIQTVKSAVQRQGFPRQRDLADALELSLATVSNFLNGKPVDFLNFTELCRRLNFDWQEIADTTTVTSRNDNGNSNGAGAWEIAMEDADDFIYVERPPIEEVCYKTLSQPGGLLRIKAPGLMGKTSLMFNLMQQMERQGYRTVLLNLHFAEATDFTSLEKFLKWFCASVSQSLHVKNRLADYWDEEFSTPKMNCTAYFEEYLLAQVSSPFDFMFGRS